MTTLKMPLYEDPRKMTIKKLTKELMLRGKVLKCSRALMIATLIQEIVNEGRMSPIDPFQFDDGQPEKWLHIANIKMEDACLIESDPTKRVLCMEDVNKYLINYSKNRIQLTSAATGKLIIHSESELFRCLFQFGAALMLAPVVQQEMQNKCKVPGKISRSIFIFSMCSGFAGIPHNLTIDYVMEKEKNIMN
jgi:hypothetical protein